MRAFTVIAAFVVGLTWALTILVCDADPQPNRILNPFRKNPKGHDDNTNPRTYDIYEGNPINAQRFSRKLDDQLAKGGMGGIHRTRGYPKTKITVKK